MNLLVIIIAIVIAWFTSQMAEQKGRSPLAWFILGFFFGIFAPIALYFLPPLEAEAPKSQSNSRDTIEVKPIEIKPEMEFESQNWYYLDEERRQQGPFPYPELKTLWSNRTVGVQSYVWCPRMEEWKRIGEVPNLIDSLGMSD